MTTRQKDWLNGEGRLLYGKHKGQLVEVVANDDPQYLQWIIDEVEDCSEEDRKVMSTLLAQRGR